VRRAVVIARGQEAITDGNGFFALRHVPILSANDRVAIEITYLRPEGRVERVALNGVAISADATASIGDLILSASNSNRPPVIIAAPGFTAEEGKTADLNFVASDPDAGQTMQVSVAGPQFATLLNRGNGAYSLRVAPGLEDAGDYTLTITATDSQNAISTHKVALTVFNTNQPPVANALVVAGDEDTPIKITLTGADPDRNALSYSIVSKPARGQLTGVAPDLTYTPDRNYFGADSFTFKVNDGAADSRVATVAITVRPVNDAPVLNVPIEQKITTGAALNFAISAMDFDPNDSLTFMALDLPQGATFNQVNATGAQFRWTPMAQQTGLHIVTFKVSDNGSPSLTTTQTVAISALAPDAGPQAGMWSATSGPTGGGATALLASGQNVFAGTLSNGVFRSTDGGATWKRASNGMPDFTRVNALARVGDTIIAAAAFGVFRSTDNGDNWAPANDGLDELAALVRSLAVKGDLVFAGTFGGVYVSADRGKTWRAASRGLPAQSLVTALTVSGASLFVSFGAGLYRSNDDGQNWTRVNNNLPQINSFAVAGATLFAGVFSGGVYRSLDGGQNWTLINAGGESLFINSLLIASDNLLVGADRGLFVLPANGQVSQLPKPVLETTINALAASGSTVFAGSARDGVFRSNDNGTSWTATNDGYTDLRALAFASAAAETFAGADAGVFVASNPLPGALQSQQRNVWRAVNKGLPEFGGVQSLAILGTNLFAGSPGGVYRLELQASDQNRVWERMSAGLPEFGAIQSIAVAGDTLFASLAIRVLPAPAGPLVFRSTDQGKTWRAASNGLPNGVVVSFAAMGGKVFAATFDGVFVSSDNGDNWTAANNGLPAQTSVLSLAVSGAGLFAGAAGRGVFVSTNQGQSWSPASVNLPSNSTVSALLSVGSNLLAVVAAGGPSAECPNGGVLIDGRCYGGIIPGPGVFNVIPGAVFISTNNGQNWAPVMSGLDGNAVAAIGSSGANVFVGTFGQGVFTRRF
jgi:photosystem II stability/assembly factor-like uncharacterized protein